MSDFEEIRFHRRGNVQVFRWWPLTEVVVFARWCTFKVNTDRKVLENFETTSTQPLNIRQRQPTKRYLTNAFCINHYHAYVIAFVTQTQIVAMTDRGMSLNNKCKIVVVFVNYSSMWCRTENCAEFFRIATINLKEFQQLWWSNNVNAFVASQWPGWAMRYPNQIAKLILSLRADQKPRTASIIMI